MTVPKAVGYAAIYAGAIIVATTLVHFYTYYVLISAPQESTKRVNETVHSLCSWARDMNSRPAFTACYMAQDKSQTEYVCPRVDAPNNECVVEDRRVR